MNNYIAITATLTLIATSPTPADLIVDPNNLGYTNVNPIPYTNGIDGNLNVGYTTHGHLIINNNTNLDTQAYFTHIGFSPATIGILEITDPGTNLSTERLFIGYHGYGFTTIQNGASINALQETTLGRINTSQGFLDITGQNSKLTTSIFNIGSIAKGTANITAAGSAIVSQAIISANGVLNIADTNSHLNAQQIQIGQSGNATLNINNQATLFSHNAIKISSGPNGYGTLNISDPNTTATTGTLNIAQYSTGIININNGAKMITNFNTTLGYQQNSHAIINIKDNNSTLTTQTLTNGFLGSGQINIARGGQLIIDQTLTQSDKIATDITLATEYLNPNFFAITGNTALASPLANGVNNVTLAGILTAQIDQNHTLQNNQTYNLMQIENNLGNRTGTFKDLPQDTSLGIYGSHELFISYTGGDGNDITLYTTEKLTDLLQGDTNFDQIVDQQDLQNVKNHFGTNSHTGDAAHNHNTNLTDLFAVRNNYNPTQTTTIPEPTAITLLILASLAISKRK